MRRAVPVLVATVLGLALLANFHTSPSSTSVTPVAPVAPLAPLPTSTETTVEPLSSTTPSSSTTTTRPTTTSSAPPCTTNPDAGDRAVDGPVERNRYGDVQVRAQLSGNQIVDVTALLIPQDQEQSREINSQAEPLLRQEALSAQSAKIDTISGATFTSRGYRDSLQAALDAAGVC